ncbi:hypothetical protein BJY52DRAFT_1300530, partial [Lactarius psammicola]
MSPPGWSVFPSARPRVTKNFVAPNYIAQASSPTLPFVQRYDTGPVNHTRYTYFFLLLFSFSCTFTPPLIGPDRVSVVISSEIRFRIFPPPPSPLDPNSYFSVGWKDCGKKASTEQSSCASVSCRSWIREFPPRPKRNGCKVKMCRVLSPGVITFSISIFPFTVGGATISNGRHHTRGRY